MRWHVPELEASFNLKTLHVVALVPASPPPAPRPASAMAP